MVAEDNHVWVLWSKVSFFTSVYKEGCGKLVFSYKYPYCEIKSKFCSAEYYIVDNMKEWNL